MATMLSQKLVEAQEANDTVRDFMRRFEVGKLLSSCRAQKTKGFSVVELFVYMVCCMFSPISTYMSMRIGSYRKGADCVQNPSSYRLRPKQSEAQGLDCFNLHGHGHF